MVLAGMLAAWPPPAALSATYYVSTNGNNTWNGLSTNTAWRSISFAMITVIASDTVRVLPGVYPEFLQIRVPITLMGSDLYDPQAAPWARHVARTIICPPDTNSPNSAVINVSTTGVKILSLTISGDSDSNGIPDAKGAIDCSYRPLEVHRCRLANIRGFGIRYRGFTPSPQPSDGNNRKGYFIQNVITNITYTNAPYAKGIYSYLAPFECVSNVFAAIQGSNSISALYVESCYYTAGMTSGLRIDHNTFRDCTAAIWTTQHGNQGEPISIRGNSITNGLVGILVGNALGKASIVSNRISVSGISDTGLTPARGIWIRADANPWTPASATDHLLLRNSVKGAATGNDGTLGLYFAYDNPATPGQNNGVRASVVSNLVAGFETGIHVLSGTDGVGIPHDPLVQVVVHHNDIEDNVAYGVTSSGSTNFVDALDNWWGSYNGPFPPGNPVSTNVTTNAAPLGSFTADTDGDGTYDWLDTNDDGGPNSDLQELFAGSNPGDSNSEFEIAYSTSIPGVGLELRWRSLTNRLYFIYRITNMLEGFTPLVWTIVAGSPPTNSWIDVAPPAGGRAFYRLTCTN